MKQRWRWDSGSLLGKNRYFTLIKENNIWVLFVRALVCNLLAAPLTKPELGETIKCGYSFVCGWVSLETGTGFSPSSFRNRLRECESNAQQNLARWRISLSLWTAPVRSSTALRTSIHLIHRMSDDSQSFTLLLSICWNFIGKSLSNGISMKNRTLK